MPQGTILAVRPIGKDFDPKDLDPKYDWIDELRNFLKENYRQDFAIGVIDSCEDGTDVKTGEKLLCIMPKDDFPDNIEEGNCGDAENGKATKVNFKLKKDPFKYAYDVKKVH